MILYYGTKNNVFPLFNHQLPVDLCQTSLPPPHDPTFRLPAHDQSLLGMMEVMVIAL